MCLSQHRTLPHVALEDPTMINCLSQVGQCMSTSPSPALLHQYPHFGAVFVVEELEVCGLPPQNYRKTLKNSNNSNL